VLTGPILVAELCVATEPLQPSEPLPPLAAHEVAPVVDQVAVTDCPVCIALGVTEKVLMTGGGGVLLTSTVTDTGVLAPPSPVHVSVYTKFPAALIGPTNSVDTGATAPLQLSAPLPPLADVPVPWPLPEPPEPPAPTPLHRVTCCCACSRMRRIWGPTAHAL